MNSLKFQQAIIITFSIPLHTFNAAAAAAAVCCKISFMVLVLLKWLTADSIQAWRPTMRAVLVNSLGSDLSYFVCMPIFENLSDRHWGKSIKTTSNICSLHYYGYARQSLFHPFPSSIYFKESILSAAAGIFTIASADSCLLFCWQVFSQVTMRKVI